MTFALTYLFVFIISGLLTGFMRRYALNSNLLDIPNARSSHVIPTPRGGGVAFVLCFILVAILLIQQGFLNYQIALPIILPAAFVALLGFLDDKYQLSAKWRLLGHMMMAILALSFLGGFTSIPLFQNHSGFVLLGGVIAMFYLVWLLNLFNFMDGIDGIAASEAICICLGGAFLYFLDGKTSDMMLPLVLAAAVAGFLIWNFPPARIFMGDAGSGFLGFVIGLFSLQAAIAHDTLFVGWLILSAVFVTDATLTLFRRALNGERLFEAHRSHAYQQAVKRYGKHGLVTSSVIFINALWLFPLAVLVQQHQLNIFLGLILAYFPLFLLAFKLKAGKN